MGLVWKTPELKDLEKLQEVSFSNALISNEGSAFNLVYYAKKYTTNIAFSKNFLLKKFYTLTNCLTYCPPLAERVPESFKEFIELDSTRLNTLLDLSLTGKENTSAIQKTFSTDLLTSYKEVYELLREDARKEGSPFIVSMVNYKDKVLLDSLYPGAIEWKIERDKCDYIYKTSDLASLKGKKMQKKKGHFNQFLRYHPAYTCQSISKNNISDILKVQEEWYKNATENVDKKSVNYKETLLNLEYENKIIGRVVKEFSFLSLEGIILYLDNLPAAFNLSSAISRKVIDTHFEKVLPSFSKTGVYSAINALSARTFNSYFLINREEDMNLPGLRRAKLSYSPFILLTKYQGVFRKN